MPLITAIFALFGVEGGMEGMSLVLNGVDKTVLDTATGKMIINPEAILWNYGNFIQAILDFLLIAIVLFCIIKAINFANDGLKRGAHKYDPLTKEEVLAYRQEGKKRKEIVALAKEKADRLTEEKRLADEEAAKNAPKTEAQLLEEIAELLKAQQSK